MERSRYERPLQLTYGALGEMVPASGLFKSGNLGPFVIVETLVRAIAEHLFIHYYTSKEDLINLKKTSFLWITNCQM